MAGTRTKTAPTGTVQARDAAPKNGALPAAMHTASAPKAYELTDPQGNRAYLWREGNAWNVEAEDAAFRRRVLQGVKRPIVAVRDEADEHGARWSKRVSLQPDDPRYGNELLWSWNQVGLEDVEARIVRRDDRRTVWPRAEAAE